MASNITPSLGNETSDVYLAGSSDFNIAEKGIRKGHEEEDFNYSARQKININPIYRGGAANRILENNYAFSVRMPHPKNPNQWVSQTLQGQEYINFVKAQNAAGHGVYCHGHDVDFYFSPSAKESLDDAMKIAKKHTEENKAKAKARAEAEKNRKWYQQPLLWFGVICAAMLAGVLFIVSRWKKKGKSSSVSTSTSSSKETSSTSTSSTNTTLAASQESTLTGGNVTTATLATSNESSQSATQSMSALRQNATAYAETPAINTVDGLERA